MNKALSQSRTQLVLNKWWFSSSSKLTARIIHSSQRQSPVKLGFLVGSGNAGRGRGGAKRAVWGFKGDAYKDVGSEHQRVGTALFTVTTAC